MAINIPAKGERLGRSYYRAFSFGLSSDADVPLDSDVGSTGTFTYALININEPNVLVEDISLQVVSKLTTSTGTFTIGDTDVDGYWTDTLLVGTTTSASWNAMSTAVAYAGGKLYTDTDVINLTKGGAAASAVHTTSLVKARVKYMRGCDTNLNPSA